jgi:hypothetical protein
MNLALRNVTTIRSKFLLQQHIIIKPSQHGFIKSKSTATKLVTFLNFVTALVCSQGQTDSSLLILAMLSTFFYMDCFFMDAVTMDYLPII